MRKSRLIVLVVTLLVVALAVPVFSNETVRRGGIVKVTEGRQGVLVKNFNPFSPNALQTTLGHFYETLLVSNNYTGQILPWLAKGYEWGEDLTTLTLFLEENVYWNDGEKFDADDVLFTFNLAKSNAALDRSGIWQQGLLAVEKLDDYTVRLTFDSVNVPILTRVAEVYMVPEHIWAHIENPSEWTGNENPVGTGPFMFVDGSFSEFSYSLTRNPNYWQIGADGQPLPYIDGVQYIGATGNEQAAMKIINGEVDWGGYFIANIDQLYVAANPEHNHYWLPEGNIVYLSLNNDVEPFNNANVRRAVAMAIDQEEITMIMDSGAQPADSSGVKRGFLHWVSDEARALDPGFDPAGAIALLEAEGYRRNSAGIMEKDGVELSFDLYVPTGWSDWIIATDVISEQLAAIGINARVAQRAWPSPFMDNLINGDYQMSMGYATSGSSAFFQSDNILHSRHYAPVGQAAASHSQVRYRNPIVDEALDAFRRSTDSEEQAELMSKVIYEFMKDTPMVPLFFNPVWFQYSTRNFTGWPNADNPYVDPQAAGMGKMLIFLNLQPVK
ncbi:MAG: ABC transporter substrate-binding protein [Firmicutes bacterium]|nr:ABC transporter substrate-binding protein [Bacillota bacterium]